MAEELPDLGDGQPRQFVTTRWSIVLRAGEEGLEEADQALAELCRTYWYPFYAYVRRQGFNEQDATDLAGWICDILDVMAKGESTEAIEAEVKAKVEEVCTRLPVYG